MKRKTFVLMLSVFIFGIVVGMLFSAIISPVGEEIHIYTDRDFKVAYHSDWPTYGLFLQEFAGAYTLVCNGKYDHAKSRLKYHYMRILEDAEKRLKVAPPNDREEIKKTIRRGKQLILEANNDTKKESEQSPSGNGITAVPEP